MNQRDSKETGSRGANARCIRDRSKRGPISDVAIQSSVEEGKWCSMKGSQHCWTVRGARDPIRSIGRFNEDCVARDVTFVPVHDYYCAEYGPSNLWRQDLVARSLVGAVGRGTKWRRHGIGVAGSMRWREISHRNRSDTVLGDENGSLVDWPAIIVDDFSKIKFLRTWLRNIVGYFVYFVSLLLYVLELCINVVWRVIEVKDESNIP